MELDPDEDDEVESNQFQVLTPPLGLSNQTLEASWLLGSFLPM